MPPSESVPAARTPPNAVPIVIGSQVRDRASEHVGRVIALTRNALVLTCDYPGGTVRVTAAIADAEVVPFTVRWINIARADEYFPSLAHARACMLASGFESTVSHVAPGTPDNAPHLVGSWSPIAGWRAQHTTIVRART